MTEANLSLLDLENAVFAILFASGESVPADKLCELCGCTKKELADAADNLSRRYAGDGGIELKKLDDEYQLCTKIEYADVIKKALDTRRNMPLSQAAMEVLAICAYNQPVTKSYIEQVRGVDCGYIVASLCEKELLSECGRLDAPGRPLLYCTTPNFLRVFNISSLDELPELEVPNNPQTIGEENA